MMIFFLVLSKKRWNSIEIIFVMLIELLEAASSQHHVLDWHLIATWMESTRRQCETQTSVAGLMWTLRKSSRETDKDIK